MAREKLSVRVGVKLFETVCGIMTVVLVYRNIFSLLWNM